MAYDIIRKKISDGKIVLLDGGIGSEIEKQGVVMNDLAWCGIAHMEQPDTVRAVHESYINAGSDVITANTFGTAPHVIKRLGLQEQTQKINADAVAIAREARDRSGKDVCVAASMSSMPAFDSPVIPAGEEFREGYFQQAAMLADAGAELIITEMMMDIKNASMVIEAARSTGLPVWTGMSASVGDDGKVYNYHDLQGFEFESMPFDNMAETLMEIGCDAAGIMHSLVDTIEPALTELGRAYSGPRFAYAESGHFVPPSWKFEKIISAEDYLDYARKWVEAGAGIIGGCCGIGPQHIKMLADNL